MSDTNILVLQHLDVETPGIFAELWRAAGHHVDVVELDQGERIYDLDPYDLLVVMGGPMDVWQHDAYPWLRTEIAAIKHWVTWLKRPYLGICLGHQLLAAALDGEIGLMAAPEVGIADIHLTDAGTADPIFRGMPHTLPALHWHGAAVLRPPEGCEILAGNTHCPNQAMRYGRTAYGFQFHIEITETTVGDWNAIPEYRASLEAALGKDGADRLAADIRGALHGFNATARQINENFWRLCE
ncbi:MAG TPA: type 1 glutamine amidotransferase [Stellaceae bacterium]|nr:type 1 glutamine amidotransferase [Stellaceae bacterium]